MDEGADVDEETVTGSAAADIAEDGDKDEDTAEEDVGFGEFKFGLGDHQPGTNEQERNKNVGTDKFAKIS